MGDTSALDAVGLAALVHRREASPLEIVDAAIARVEHLNPSLNAVVRSMFVEARAEALKVDLSAPLAGVPFLLKDLLAEYGGVPLSEGSRFLGERYVPAADSALVARYRRAGLVVIGKSNTPELGLVSTTEPELFGPARNPWDRERTTGGSSGGSAAAVASGMVPAAHANDGGGSIRIPAACCGLFGLKPTRARNPVGPSYGDIFGGIVAEHAVTISVRDSAAILDATAGPSPGDPYPCAPPARPFLAEVGAEPGRLRIAVSSRTFNGREVDPRCRAAVEETARLCERLGHDVAEASPAFDGRRLGAAFVTIWSAGCAWSIDDWSRRLKRTPTPPDFEPLTWELYQRGARLTASEYLLAVQDVQATARVVADFFTSWDAWLTPTLGEPPVPLGSFSGTAEDPTSGLRRMGGFAPFTYLANLTGQPAMSVPLAVTDGLPIGSHFLGRYGEEATLFRLAGQLEAAHPWAGRRPPVHLEAPVS